MKQVENGGQCYVVCPAIEKNEDEEESYLPTSLSNIDFIKNDSSNLKNAVEHADFLGQKLSGIQVECMHGKMKSSEKDDIMKRFASGEIKVLVSTTVIEVGVNVPNATLMIVENAERFGLSQLHQLRGRVGRGNKKSYCVLVSSLDTEKAKSRLNIMKTTYDGYEIAEKDLIMRGPGDFFVSADTAMRQSGGFEFKLAKLCDDNSLFSLAFSIAKSIVDKDPELSKEENKALRQALGEQATNTLATLS
jgi:ATP-dependent DNA helicase RecG